MDKMKNKSAHLGTGMAENARKTLKGRHARIAEAVGNDINGTVAPAILKGKAKPKARGY